MTRRSARAPLNVFLNNRHVETGRAAGLSVTVIEQAMADLHAGFDAAFAAVEAGLPDDFPEAIHAAVLAGARDRLRQLQPGGGVLD